MQHSGEIREIAELMRDFTRPWAVAGGWAIDLFLGRETRSHADVDVVIFRDDQLALREHLRGWTWRKVVEGELVEWRDGEWLQPGVFELHAERRDASGSAHLEFLLNDRDRERWIYRRDPRVSCPVEEAILASSECIPILSPAIVLLYKAKATRETDERDFAAVRDALGAERRAWLRAALDTAHPGHRWIEQL
jgi:hypothetical protein